MKPSGEAYQLVQLPNGVYSLRSLVEAETFHPGIGPVAEAEALYVKQLKLRCRMQSLRGEFVVWDVGLGAAANALTAIQATRDLPAHLRLVSFDRTLGALQFALNHADQLDYFHGCQELVQELAKHHRVVCRAVNYSVDWSFYLADFPTLIRQWVHRHRNCQLRPATEEESTPPPPPHIIMFDAYSPAKNPAMWTYSLFHDLFQLLDPQRPCALATYSRSTLLRTTLLLAGFFVGSGRATGEKEETTIAANTLDLLAQPLNRDWLRRALRSTSAEPLCEPLYRQAPLSPPWRAQLEQHPQWQAP